MATLEIKDSKGKAVGKHELSEKFLSFEPSNALLHKAVVTEEANSRQGTQSAKTRSETRGGGRKPYKQKKTGNARQGTIRAPHYAHGGMAFAVKPRDYEKKMNRKERRAAIMGAINAQVIAGNVIVVDKINFATPKTKDAIALLTTHGLQDTRRVLVVTTAYDEVACKCFRNLGNVVVRTAPTNEANVKTVAFSTRDFLVAHKIIITADALKAVEAVWATGEAKDLKTARVEAKQIATKAVKAEKAAKAEAAKPTKAKAPAKAKAEKAPVAEKAEKAPAAEAPVKKAPAKKKKSEEAEG